METGPNLRILVVEDDPIVAKVIVFVLERELSASIDIAHDCAAAREFLSTGSYDLVTLDYQLPDGNGLELLAEINSVKAAPPVVMVTGHGDEGVAVRSFELGASGYVVKDARMKALLGVAAQNALAADAQKKAELALRESEARYRLLTDRMNDILWTCDLEMMSTFVTPSVEKVLGFTTEENMVMSPAEKMTPQSLALVADTLAREIAADAPRDPSQRISLEIDFYHRDGSVRCLETVLSFILDEAGNPAGIHGVSRDVTGRKEAEERFESLFRHNPALMALTTLPERRFVDANDAFLEALGYSREDVIGRTSAELGLFADPEQREAIAEKLAAEGRVLDLGVQVRCRDGSLIDGLFSGEVISMRGKDYFLSVMLDVTEQKRAEEELRESEAEARRLLDGICVTGSAGEGTIDLGRMIDTATVQSIMDDFCRLTGIGVAIADLKGEVLVATGWQDICTRFHRVHPETRSNCIESDTVLSRGVSPGEFKMYRCKNNMWDIATPIMLDDVHAGNLFLGQFFFEDEVPDYETFRAMARRYGFDEKEYMAALDRVPRWSHETVENVMSFYAKFANMISTLSHGNTRLAQNLLERERLLNSLRLREELLNESQRISRVGGWEWDIARQMMFWTDEAYRIHGLDPGDIEPGATEHIDRSIECYDPGDRPVVLAAFERCMEKGVPYDLEFPFTAFDGRRLWIRTTARATKEGGAVAKVIGIIVDITGRKLAEEHLRLANEELKAYAHSISHDLKGPISAVYAAAGFLNEAVQDSADADADEALTLLRNNAEKATHRIDALLRLAESAQEPDQVEIVDVGGVVGEVLEDLSGIILEKGSEVTVDEDMGELLAGREHLRLIFSNLLSNAVRHNDSDRPLVRVSCLGNGGGGTLMYLVRDNGSGIPPDELESIFAPFHKGQDTGGHGIGLSVVQKIAGVYGGGIRAYNDGGACFELTLNDYSEDRTRD